MAESYGVQKKKKKKKKKNPNLVLARIAIKVNVAVQCEYSKEVTHSDRGPKVVIL